MPEFLDLIPPSEAMARLLANLPAAHPRAVVMPTERALGMVSARSIAVPEALPAFNRSTVDGYAVVGRDTIGASDGVPAYLYLAGSHLLDPATGEYNVGYLQRYLGDLPVTLIAWGGRLQGLLLKKGNPKQIQGLPDLVRPDVRFCNRQRGAGTRILLDYHLQKETIDPQIIQGYDQEEYTHLGISAAVDSGRADCGLGILGAARALDLDFIPLFTERYDLVIPCSFLAPGSVSANLLALF